jgi:hypothetical protein
MRRLAAALALIMIVSSVPAPGFLAVSSQLGPSLTLDLCHPLQSLERSPGTLIFARPAPPKIGFETVSRETIFHPAPVLKGKFVKEIDPPPPKFTC